ncbi:MAG: endonuclease/exonuclease/phosphatase family protein [Phycisphaerales bacterium]|nr:MAG: endonuclease/exonuclease/phosphatase family protein [Phycisphaerales bacterium]
MNVSHRFRSFNDAVPRTPRRRAYPSGFAWLCCTLLAVGIGISAGCQAPDRTLRNADRFAVQDSPVAPGADPRAASLYHPDLIVGSWNIKWFGSSNPDVRDYVTMADVIEEFDVVAIQELRGSHYQECVDELLDELSWRGRSYQAQISGLTGYDSNPGQDKNDYTERFAYIWDTTRVEMVGSPRFHSSPVINNSVFRQVPYIADFKVVGGNGFDFRVLTVHTVFNEKLNGVRADEIRAVKQWMIAEARGLEKNIVAIGDFNANPSRQPKHFATIIPDGTDFRVLMYESKDAGETPVRTTIQQKDNPTSTTYFQKPVYDHMLVSHETSYALTANPMTRAGGHMGVVEFDQDPWWKENGWTWNDIITAVSDHRPVWFRMDFDAPDND